MRNTVRADINLDAMSANLRAVKQLVHGAKILAVVKADAYGHGLAAAAQAFADADGLAVARMEEALRLRHSGNQGRIVLMGTYLDSQSLWDAAHDRIDLVIHHPEQIEQLTQTRALPAPINVWLKFDSGMHRLGLDREALQQAYQRLRDLPLVRLQAILTHFANADEPAPEDTEQQFAQFLSASQPIPLPRSSANSAALLRFPETHQDWVRPGLMLYGVSPINNPSIPLQPALSLHATVVALRDVASGESVGYGSTWTASRPSRIATLGIGYGDGYPRHARNGTPVLINGRPCPLAGRVSMDLITVDVTEQPACRIGDQAELWGSHLPIEEVAAHADTIPYTLMTGLSVRVPRHHLHLSQD